MTPLSPLRIVSGMTSGDETNLLERARHLGIHVQVRDCAVCAGAGSLSHPDPLDLKRWREKHGVSVIAFAARVKRPGAKTKGVSIGFISMVENCDHKQSRRCPPWLLAEYLAIPEKKWPPISKAPQHSREAMAKARRAKEAKKR